MNNTSLQKDRHRVFIMAPQHKKNNITNNNCNTMTNLFSVLLYTFYLLLPSLSMPIWISSSLSLICLSSFLSFPYSFPAQLYFLIPSTPPQLPIFHQFLPLPSCYFRNFQMTISTTFYHLLPHKNILISQKMKAQIGFNYISLTHPWVYLSSLPSVLLMLLLFLLLILLLVLMLMPQLVLPLGDLFKHKP